MRPVVLIALVLILAACKAPETGEPPRASATQPDSPSRFTPPPPPDDGRSTQDFDGLVRDTPHTMWLEKWGPPSRTDTFTMDEGMPEFRIELYNDFPPDDPKNATVEIREDTWIGRGYDFTLWSQKNGDEWLALQAISYLHGVEF